MMKKLLPLLILLSPAFVFAGSASYTTPGSYTFTVPATSNGSITVQVWGGGGGATGGYGGLGGSGGGGGGYTTQTLSTASLSDTVTVTVGSGGAGGTGGVWMPDASAGSASSFGPYLYAAGGAGATGYHYPGGANPSSWRPGAGGSYSGGSGHAGGAGGAGGFTNNPSGASCQYDPNYETYTGCTGYSATCAGGGGGGGTTPSNILPYPQPFAGGSSGCGGTGGTGQAGAVSGANGSAPGGGGGGGGTYGSAITNGGSGGAGRVSITWEDAPATCSVSFSANPIVSGDSTTLTWSSSGADNYTYIENVGYLYGSGGSFSVGPSTTTDYSCYAAGTGGSDGWHSYELTVYQNCSFNEATVGHGDSVTAYESDSVPYGDTCTSQTRTCADGTLSGTYTYASCEVSLASCTLDGVTVAHGDSYTFYSSQTGSPCSSIAQERICTDGSLSGSASYQYASCTCAPLYSCSGNDITYTDASCATTTVLSCVAPYFCSPGTSTCVSPEPVFNTDGTRSGHLQAAPTLVPPLATATLYWNVSNVESCSVSGTNGDSWSGLSGEKTTSPISAQTTYTLSCVPLEGASFSNESVTINVVPIFQEL